MSSSEFQRLANNEALTNYPEYADRFSSIKKLKGMFEKENVNWALAYSTDLFVRGLIDNFNDLDIWVQDSLGEDGLTRMLADYNIKVVSTDNDKVFTTEYFLKCEDLDTGVQIEIINHFGMRVNQIDYIYPLKTVEHFRIGNITLPIINLCDLYILYAILEDSWQPKRRYKRELIENFIKENMSPVKFDFPSETCFPDWIWERIHFLET